MELRFDNPLVLLPIGDQQIAEELIVTRLRATYKEYGFHPPYPSWPFKPEAFDIKASLKPRELLKACDTHRQNCIRNKQVK